MPIRLSITLAVSLLVLGASYAFADGILNDASTTRSRGGVGNYLFWTMRDATLGEDASELTANESAFEDEPAFLTPQELTLRQSSTIAPIRSVTFPRGSARITADETERLDEIASALKADPSLKAKITGYADSQGATTKNQALSEARAKAVVNGLESRGISASQLSWNAKGEREPLSENDTEEGRAQNRRAEIHFE